MTYDGHTTWCSHHGTGEGHSPDYYPYCYAPAGRGIDLYPDDDGNKPALYVYATTRASDKGMEGDVTAPDDKRYEGVELLLDIGAGDETFMRMTTSTARSLAAGLTRAADIGEGLTR